MKKANNTKEEGKKNEKPLRFRQNLLCMSK